MKSKSLGVLHQILQNFLSVELPISVEVGLLEFLLDSFISWRHSWHWLHRSSEEFKGLLFLKNTSFFCIVLVPYFIKSSLKLAYAQLSGLFVIFGTWIILWLLNNGLITSTLFILYHWWISPILHFASLRLHLPICFARLRGFCLSATHLSNL